MLVTDPALLDADPAEISDHLLDAGLHRVETWRSVAGMVIVAQEGDVAVEAALSGFSPTTGSGVLWAPLPAAVSQHLQHMKDYREAVRSGSQAAKTAGVRQAEAEHVLADIIDALRLIRSEFE
jgi:hypothetical protein